MILVINSDHWTKQFCNYLSKNQYSFVTVEVKNLIDDIQIYDYTSTYKQSCLWSSLNDKINFKNINGIFHRLNHIAIDHFDHFEDSDIDYIQNEWLAYLLYRLSAIDNVINPIHHKYMTESTFNYLLAINRAKKSGLETPDVYYNSCSEHLRQYVKKSNKNYIYRKSITDNFCLKQNLFSLEAIAVIEDIIGAAVFVHVVGEKLIGTTYFHESRENYYLDNEIEKKILHLTQEYSLLSAELMFKLTKNGKLVFYYISCLPNWNLCLLDEDYIWQLHVNLLSRQSVNRKIKPLVDCNQVIYPLKKSSFITQAIRPFVHGSLIDVKNSQLENCTNEKALNSDFIE